MLRKRDDKLDALAEHGLWIGRMREDVKVLSQRLRGLERRLATSEGSLAELSGIYNKLDLALSRLAVELDCLKRKRAE